MKSLVVALSIFLASCASITTPRNADDSLLYALGQVTATRDTCTNLGQTQKITKDDVTECLKATDEARKYIDIAKGAQSPFDKENALRSALAILTTLEALLKERQ
jgi:hypothetical protein